MRVATLVLAAALTCLGAASAHARLVEVIKPWGRVWISVPEPAGDSLPEPSSRCLAFRDAIAAACERNAVDPSLVEAIIACESAFDVNAVSGAGAMGLMQLMPETAKSLGVTDAFDVEQNIDGGTRHLASLLESFEGNRRLAIAAYNAGEGAVRRAGGIPAYPETIHYVHKVEHYLSRLGGGVTMEPAPATADAPVEVASFDAAAASPVEVEPPPPAKPGKPVMMGRDAQGRLVFVNKPTKGKR